MIRLDRTLLCSSLLCLAPMVPSGVFYSRLPERVAVHFNAAGQADGFAPRWFAAFGLPLLLLLVNVFVHLRLNHDPQRQNASAVLAQAGRWIAPLASVVTVAVLLIHALRGPVNFHLYFSLLAGVLVTVAGNYLPKCRQNRTVGIKLPWTLRSEANWNKTHRAAGFVWIAGGLMLIAGAFLPVPWLEPAVAALLVLFPLLYSFALHKRGS